MTYFSTYLHPAKSYPGTRSGGTKALVVVHLSNLEQSRRRQHQYRSGVNPNGSESGHDSEDGTAKTTNEAKIASKINGQKEAKMHVGMWHKNK
jgi:hypothetical protein